MKSRRRRVPGAIDVIEVRRAEASKCKRGREREKRRASVDFCEGKASERGTREGFFREVFERKCWIF